MYKPLSGSLVFNSLYIYINRHFRVVWWGIICKQVRHLLFCRSLNDSLKRKTSLSFWFLPSSFSFHFYFSVSTRKNKEKHYLTCGSAFGFYPSELQSFVCKHLAAEKARLKMKPGKRKHRTCIYSKDGNEKGNKCAFFSSPCPQPCSKCKWCICVLWNCFGN